MGKRILFIDSDESFARGLSAAATANGFVAMTATNSEQGMALAKRATPDLIVVCVEAQPTNGYMLFTRLKKDSQLKDIPVILTSANATPDSFEKHKKLKTRAEEYLIKPFGARVMLEKASQLLGAPLQEAEEEIVSMEDESLGLGDLVAGEDEPIQLSEREAAQAHEAGGPEQTLIVEEVEELDVEEDPPQKAAGDDDLEMFDQAFDALKPAGEGAPLQRPRLRVAPDPQPARPKAEREPTELSAPSDEEMLGLDLASDEPLELELSEPKKSPPAPEPQRLKDARRGDKDALRLKEELDEKDKQLLQLEKQAQQLKDEAARRDAAAKALQQRADALAAAAKKFERELTQAREELKGGGGKTDARRLAAELEKAREEVHALTGEKDLLRDEREELRKQLAEAQKAAEQNEQRAVKAYQKIKQDEKLREKTRKALQIALALLEQSPADSEAGEPEKKSA